MEGIEIALIGRGELPVWGKAAPLRIGLMDNSPPTDTQPLGLQPQS